jgi:hypothetical protein
VRLSELSVERREVDLHVRRNDVPAVDDRLELPGLRGLLRVDMFPDLRRCR